MKKLLKKIDKKELYYLLNGEKRILDRADPETYPSGLTGNISSGLFGDCSGLEGEINSGLFGDCGGLFGEINNGLTGDIGSGLHGEINARLRGNCTGIMGNIDHCELTDEERREGVYIELLIASQ